MAVFRQQRRNLLLGETEQSTVWFSSENNTPVCCLSCQQHLGCSNLGLLCLRRLPQKHARIQNFPCLQFICTQTNAGFFLGLLCERLSTAGALITTPQPGVGRTEKEHAPSADSTALIRDHRDTEIAQSVTVAIYRAVAMTTQSLGNQTHEELNLGELCASIRIYVFKSRNCRQMSLFAY